MFVCVIVQNLWPGPGRGDPWGWGGAGAGGHRRLHGPRDHWQREVHLQSWLVLTRYIYTPCDCVVDSNTKFRSIFFIVPVPILIHCWQGLGAGATRSRCIWLHPEPGPSDVSLTVPIFLKTKLSSGSGEKIPGAAATPKGDACETLPSISVTVLSVQHQ